VGRFLNMVAKVASKKYKEGASSRVKGDWEGGEKQRGESGRYFMNTKKSCAKL